MKLVGTFRFHLYRIPPIKNCNLCAREHIILHSSNFCYLFSLFETILLFSFVYFERVLVIYPTKFEIHRFVIDPCIAAMNEEESVGKYFSAYTECI
jgi:hypothetical protein